MKLNPTSYFSLPGVLEAKASFYHESFRSMEFDFQDSAMNFAERLETMQTTFKNTVAVCHVPASVKQVAGTRKESIPGSILETSAKAISGGDLIAQPAIDWASSSYWMSECGGVLEYAVGCLESDLEEGDGNGVSLTMAAKYIKRLKAAIRYQAVATVTTKQTQEKWEVLWMENLSIGANEDGPWQK